MSQPPNVDLMRQRMLQNAPTSAQDMRCLLDGFAPGMNAGLPEVGADLGNERAARHRPVHPVRARGASRAPGARRGPLGDAGAPRPRPRRGARAS